MCMNVCMYVCVYVGACMNHGDCKSTTTSTSTSLYRNFMHVTIAFDWQSCLAPAIGALRAARMSTDQHTTDVWITSVTDVGKIMRSVRYVARSPPITSNHTYCNHNVYVHWYHNQLGVCVSVLQMHTLLYKVDSSSIFKNPCNHVIQSNGHI